jgi:hypothetical protein
MSRMMMVGAAELLGEMSRGVIPAQLHVAE